MKKSLIPPPPSAAGLEGLMMRRPLADVFRVAAMRVTIPVEDSEPTSSTAPTCRALEAA